MLSSSRFSVRAEVPLSSFTSPQVPLPFTVLTATKCGSGEPQPQTAAMVLLVELDVEEVLELDELDELELDEDEDELVEEELVEDELVEDELVEDELVDEVLVVELLVV